MKLCYVDKQQFLWFTDTPIDRVWGDDWDDAPYEHNAGAPYLKFGPYEKLIIDEFMERPGEGNDNSRYSVQDINTGAVAWLIQPSWVKNGLVLPAGIEKDQVLELCKERSIDVYELRKM